MHCLEEIIRSIFLGSMEKGKQQMKNIGKPSYVMLIIKILRLRMFG